MKLPNFENWSNGELSNIGHNFSNKVIHILMLSKNVNNKNWNRIFYFKIQQAPSELLLPNAKKSAQKG